MLTCSSAAPKANNYTKKFFLRSNIRILNLSLNELKQIPKTIHIKDYKNMSKERLLSILSESELVESEKNFDEKH